MIMKRVFGCGPSEIGAIEVLSTGVTQSDLSKNHIIAILLRSYFRKKNGIIKTS
jgi:hypothetical protein